VPVHPGYCRKDAVNGHRSTAVIVLLNCAGLAVAINSFLDLLSLVWSRNFYCFSSSLVHLVIRCVQQLKYHTQINVRSTRGRNARGRKITGVEPFPGEDKVIVVNWR